jgi:hypothetical protein
MADGPALVLYQLLIASTRPAGARVVALDDEERPRESARSIMRRGSCSSGVPSRVTTVMSAFRVVINHRSHSWGFYGRSPSGSSASRQIGH